MLLITWKGFSSFLLYLLISIEFEGIVEILINPTTSVDFEAVDFEGIVETLVNPLPEWYEAAEKCECPCASCNQTKTR